jgi:hypothetical protein
VCAWAKRSAEAGERTKRKRFLGEILPNSGYEFAALLDEVSWIIMLFGIVIV